MARTTKPDKTFIEETAKHLNTVWQKAHNKWKKVDTYYQGTYQLWDDSIHDRSQLKTGRPSSIIDQAVDNFLSGTPRVKRPPTKDTKVAKARADNIEKWLKVVLNTAAILEPQPTWKQAAKHLALYGYAMVEVVLSMSDRPEEPDRSEFQDDDAFDSAMTLFKNSKKAWMPFRVRAPHPARILLDPIEKIPTQAIKIVNRYAKELHDITHQKDDEGKDVEIFEIKKNPYELIKCIEYWDKDWHGLIADKKLLFVERNDWGFVPYAHCFSGWGQENTDEKQMNPKDMAVGLLDRLFDDLKAKDQAFTGRHNALMTAAWTKYGTPQDESEIAEQMQRGDIIGGVRQSDIWIIPTPQWPQWMFASEQDVESEIVKGSFSPALAGNREQGVSTVGQQAILSSAAIKKFVTPSEQIEHLATLAARYILRLMDVLDEDVTVEGITQKVKDIENDYSVHVKFRLVDPVMQLEQRRLGLAEVQSKVRSKETFWDADVQLEDVTGEKERILADMVEESPEVIALLAQEVAKKIGILDLLESFQQQQLEQQQQQQQTQDGAQRGGQGLGPAPVLFGPNGEPMTNGVGSTVGLSGAANQQRQALTPQVPGPGRVSRLAGGQIGR